MRGRLAPGLLPCGDHRRAPGLTLGYPAIGSLLEELRELEGRQLPPNEVLVDFGETNEPRMIAFHCFLDEEGKIVTGNGNGRLDGDESVIIVPDESDESDKSDRSDKSDNPKPTRVAKPKMRLVAGKLVPAEQGPGLFEGEGE